MSEDVVDMVEQAQKKGKFNLVDAIKNRAYPEKAVDIYLDAAAAYELEEVNQELNKSHSEELQAKAEELTARILESKLTFHMRGVGQEAVERITQEADKLYPTENGTDNPEWLKHYVCALVAENIFKVTDSEGQEDTNKFTTEEIIEIRGQIPIDSWDVIVDTMQKLTLASSYFDKVTDAGFLPKS